MSIRKVAITSTKDKNWMKEIINISKGNNRLSIAHCFSTGLEPDGNLGTDENNNNNKEGFSQVDLNNMNIEELSAPFIMKSSPNSPNMDSRKVEIFEKRAARRAFIQQQVWKIGTIFLTIYVCSIVWHKIKIVAHL